MALLCLATLAGGLLAASDPGRQEPNAIRVGPQARSVPADGNAGATATASISLTALVQESSAARTTTSTSRPATTVTTAKVTTTTTARAPVTTSATQPAGVPPPSTTPLTPLTTLLAKVVPPALAVTGTLTRSDSGVASWFEAPDATCAHRTLPLGTIVKVTRSQGGASASCRVDDRGPTVETGRLIDLSGDTFEKLASKDAGLIDVRIEW